MSHDEVPVLPAEGGFRRYRATLAYDGTGLHGWARQPGLPTVQGLVEDSLQTVLRMPIPVTCAGRTDAGVHAAGQVIHFDAPQIPDPAATLRRLNAVLPPAVRVWTLECAPVEFDARFAATSRRYRYLICDDSRGPDPLLRWQVWSVPYQLDEAAMDEVAQLVVGEHDFGSFCRPKPGGTTIRTVRSAEWDRRPDGLVALVVSADAFCHSMVRSIVGACVEVGRGKRDQAWFAALLAHPSRQQAAPVAPPSGLVLLEVGYPADDQLEAQVRKAKRRR